jgi:hypothetical protein
LHGKGERKSAEGEIYRGNWIQGKLTGEGEHIIGNLHYKGHFKDNLEHGKGILETEEYIYKG